jgi:endonuclease/exonuclease/phosphatase family metal-dependent hydrolase
MCYRFLVSVVAVHLVLAATADSQTPVRVATWNIQATGTTASTQWTRAVAILGRIDADIVAVEEVTSLAEVATFATLAAQAGYAHAQVSQVSGTLSGNLYLGVLSKHPIVFSDSHSSAELSGDPAANDISRDVFEAHVQVPGAADVTAVFVLHLKSGSNASDEFRRAIEMRRCMQAVALFTAAHPGAPYVALGDFNEDLGDGPFGNQFNSLPGGLPQTFTLGADLSFPIAYDIFNTLTASGLVIADATQEDSTTLRTTRQSSGRRLDYIVHSTTMSASGDEVYNSARDDGVDQAPAGNFLAKVGLPLGSTFSLDASDHFLVFGDFTLPAAQILRYPGSGEDLLMSTGIGGAPTTGPLFDVKTAGAGDLLYVHFVSPSGTFDFAPPLLVAQIFAFGNPPLGPLLGLHVNTAGAVVLVNGLDGGPLGLQEVIAPGAGNTHVYLVPAGLAPFSVMLQTLAVSSLAANGFFAASDAHEIQMVP